MTRKRRLGDLQLAIMQVLWDRGSAAATDVHQDLNQTRALAITTVKSMISKLEERGVVAHRRVGRKFIYYPVVARDDVCQGMVDDLVQSMFSGDPTALVNHLIEAGEIDPSRVDALKEEIARKRKQGDKK